MPSYFKGALNWTAETKVKFQVFSPKWHAQIIFFFLILFSTTLSAADRIRSITVAGNTKANSKVVQQASSLDIGMEITDQLLIDARGKLLTVGLFDSVEITASKPEKGQVDIKISVQEKMSWFVIPMFQFSEGSIGGGLGFAETNLFGHFKKFGAFADWGQKSRHAGIAYRDPGVLGSQMILSLDALIRQEESSDYRNREVIRKLNFREYGATFLPGIQWSENFSTSLGLFYRKIEYFKISDGSGLRSINTTNGHDPAIVVEFQYKSMKNIEGLLTGARISLESQISDNRFFSDYNYFRQILRSTYGRLFFNSRLNWVAQGTVQFVSNQSDSKIPYIRELTAGGLNLRGYLNQQFRGDTRYSLNQEVMISLFKWKKIISRLLLFHDSSILYFKDQKFSREAWINGSGFGLRFYLKGINIPLIGYDFGWGYEDATFAHYLNIGTTF